ncbi:30S ribosomal protein S18 [Patescibacteria group bacterium]
MRKKNTNPIKQKKFCYFCVSGIRDLDYKKTGYLRKFLTPYGKIAPSRRIGTCARHQRQLSKAVKRARIMALLPFVKS